MDTDNFLGTRYLLQESIYQSNNGSLFKAFDTENQEQVIVKFFSQALKGAYLRETAAAFGLEHPHIATCLDTFYLDDGRACLVYEYFPHGNLRNYLQCHSRLPVEQVHGCVQGVLSALQHVHGLGLIHCDIKPENILLRYQAGHLDCVLSDLGAAAPEREVQARAHTTASPAYVAPERLYDKFSYNSDLYSLGVLAFEMLVGERPFYGSMAELSQAHLTQEPPLKRIQNHQWRDFIGQLLAKDPQQRVASASEALHVLQQLYKQDKQAWHERPLKTFRIVEEAVSELPHVVQLEHISQQQITYPQQQILKHVHLLTVQSRPLIGLQYSHHLEFIQPLELQVGKLIMNVGQVQILNRKQLAYSSQQAIYLLDLARQERKLICEGCDDLQKFCLKGEHLLWTNSRYGFLHQLDGKQLAQYQHRHYLMDLELSLLDGGNFVHSGGTVGHSLLLRNTHANILQEWELNGPVIHCQSAGRYILAVSLNMDSERTQYTVWRLARQHAPQQYELPEHSLWFTSPGYIYWLNADDELYACDKQLKIRKISQLKLPYALDQLFLSHDQHFLVGLTSLGEIEDQQHQISLDLWHLKA